MVGLGKVSITNTGMMKMNDKECPKCHKNGIEIIVINFDRDTGMARCKLCLLKMRLKDYYYWEQHTKIARGGRI